MPLPLSITAPAVAASLAYFNARSSTWYDLFLLRCVITAASRMYYREWTDRLNLYYLLENIATNSSTSDRALLIFEGKRLSYKDVYEQVLKYGQWLKNEGVKKGDIVALDFQNSGSYIFVWLGLWSIGAKPAFLNYNLSGASLIHCLKAATTKLCIVDPNVEENVGQDVRDQLNDIRFIVHTPEVEAQIAATEGIRAPDSDRSEKSLSSMAILIYTSGTTGMPKAAIVSWGKLIVAGSMSEQLLDRSKGDIMYSSMPLYHSSATIFSFSATLLSGSTQALGRKFSTKTFWNEVRDSGATSILYVGETLRYLLAAPPQHDPETGECLDKKHNVKVAFGNGLRPDIWNEFKERFGVEGICEFYAATEGTFATFNLSKNDYAAGAIGRNGWVYNLIMSFSVALVEVDWETDLPKRNPDTGRCYKARTGEPGEMLFRLPSGNPFGRFQGYYNNRAATEAKVLRDVFSKGDTWFRTGDVVRWDSDGRIYFHDRIGDTFRWKGENVSTAEVSDALCKHPSVKEANVYGVSLPHHDGRAGCAAVHLSTDPTAETMQDIATHVRTELPKFARPLFLRIMSELGGGQITGTMKQQKHALREAGVDPIGDKSFGEIYWLKEESYVPFTEKDWKEIQGGKAKL
ncbi:FAT1-very long-chain fatty acyl synthetase [Fusarium pseudocircinatum]|uniref:Very long-chain fatty acid transport protein n=1 Tax=Fusarium pseudocircinatum TaxID=56676 RepID=A0A8H5UZW1_9HYPO|nr:FAT1-very long-chain fatty acyl synthetase [Fusarium pseudocircinatum]